MRAITCLTLAVWLLAGCTFQIPSDRYIYKLACKALQETPGLPGKVVPARMEEARVSVGKSAAWVELPYEYVDDAGGKGSGVHVVWFKRVARTWTVNRVEPRSEIGQSQNSP